MRSPRVAYFFSRAREALTHARERPERTLFWLGMAKKWRDLAKQTHARRR